MKTELEEKLFKKFPIIFRNIKSIECNDGWYNLIYDLSKKLEKIANNQAPPTQPGLLKKLGRNILSKSEKLNIKPGKTLGSYCPDKLYLWLSPEQDERLTFLQIKEKFGLLRVYTNSYSDEIDRLIDEAETKSENICEYCGGDGKFRSIRGWHITLCDIDFEKYKSQRRPA